MWDLTLRLPYTLRHWEREGKQAGGKRQQQQRKTHTQDTAEQTGESQGKYSGCTPLFRERIFKETICSKCLYYFHRIVSIGKSTSITKLQDVHSFPHFFIQSSILNRQTDNNNYHAYCHKSLSTAFKEIASWGPDKSLITQVARKGVGGGGELEFQPSNSRAYTYSLPQLLNSNWALLYFIVHICRDSHISFSVFLLLGAIIQCWTVIK